MRHGRPMNIRTPQTVFAQRLCAWIDANEYTMQEAALRLSVNVRTLRRWLDETVMPHPRSAKEIESVLNAGKGSTDEV